MHDGGAGGACGRARRGAIGKTARGGGGRGGAPPEFDDELRADAEVVEHLRFFHDCFPLSKQKEAREQAPRQDRRAERALLDKKGRLPKEGDARTVAIAEAAVRRLNPLIELLRAGQEWPPNRPSRLQKNRYLSLALSLLLPARRVGCSSGGRAHLERQRRRAAAQLPLTLARLRLGRVPSRSSRYLKYW